MAANYPPVPPTQPPYAQATPAKKSNVLLWVLLILGGLVLFCVLAVVGVGYFVVHKAKQAGLDTDLMRRNPGLAAVKIAAAVNRDIEIVSYDESKSTVTIRNKKTGQTSTVSFNDAKNGRFSESPGSVEIKSPDGAASFGGNVALKLPSWLPQYPGSKPVGAFSTENGDSNSGSFQFTTKDSADQIAKFYEEAFKGAGMKTTKTITSGNDKGSGMVSAEEGDRSVVAMITPDDSGANVNVTYKAGK